MKKETYTKFPTKLLPNSNMAFIAGTGTEMLCFSRHLRNSIAHCLIEKKGSQIFLSDFSGVKPSMIALFEIISLIEIIELFVNHFKSTK
ncbi:MAG: hypothetical protein JZU47_08035 [Prolixibacteraceae bacterium]|nr:hypothetical protein [Prolixibacteraceae bacterium]